MRSYLKKASELKRTTKVLICITIVLLVVGIYLGRQVLGYRTSVEAYCDTYHQETNLGGGINLGPEGNGRRAEIYTKLEKVAPKDIRQDNKTLKETYGIARDPARQAVLSKTTTPESRIQEWVDKNCESRPGLR